MIDRYLSGWERSVSSWDESTEQGRASLGIAERFYDAVTQPDAWFGAVSSLLASFGGKTALLVLDSPDGLQPITMPGFTDHSLFPMAAKHAGLPFEALCDTLARLALRDIAPYS